MLVIIHVAQDTYEYQLPHFLYVGYYQFREANVKVFNDKAVSDVSFSGFA